MVKMFGWLSPFQLKGWHLRQAYQRWLKRVEASMCVKCQDELTQVSRPAWRGRKLISISAHSNLLCPEHWSQHGPKSHHTSLYLSLSFLISALLKNTNVNFVLHSIRYVCKYMSNQKTALGVKCSTEPGWGGAWLRHQSLHQPGFRSRTQLWL